MKIHEFQAKELLRQYGVDVPAGKVARTGAAAEKVAHEVGGKVIVKAQIHAGGRGKGGGVKLAQTPQETSDLAAEILGMRLVTPQTGPEGQNVKQVLVEAASDIEREFYLGMTLDRAQSKIVVMASQEGGSKSRRSPREVLRRSSKKRWIPRWACRPSRHGDWRLGWGWSPLRRGQRRRSSWRSPVPTRGPTARWRRSIRWF